MSRGSNKFVQGLLSEMDEHEKETLLLSSKIKDLGFLARSIEKNEGITGLRSGSRTHKVSKARRLFCQLAVGKMGYPGAEVVRFLGVTSSAIVRATKTEELKEVQKIPVSSFRHSVPQSQVVTFATNDPFNPD